MSKDGNSPSSDKRSLGRAAEDFCVQYIVDRGGRILCRNYTTPYGEIDIIADFGGEFTAFIEVKCRRGSTFGSPAEAVSTRKQRRYLLSASIYLSDTPDAPQPRFDVAEVSVDKATGVFIMKYDENAYDFSGAESFY